jgi:hypothetical protein
MPISTRNASDHFGGRWGRCKNCKKRFPKTRDDRLYCSDRCKNQYNNYGRTPEAQMVARFKSFMRTQDFKTLMREAVRKTVREEVQALTARGAETQERNSVSKSIPGRPSDTSQTKA